MRCDCSLRSRLNGIAANQTIHYNHTRLFIRHLLQPEGITFSVHIYVEIYYALTVYIVTWYYVPGIMTDFIMA